MILGMRRDLLLAALLAAAPAIHAATPSSSPRFAVPFIDDDYGRALKEAREKNVPIFVENWAPW
jgi:hypothetical protein